MHKETEKPKMTKEQLAKAWKEYYNWLHSIYPLERFELQGKDKEILHFYHGFNTKSLDNEISQILFFKSAEYFTLF